MAANERVQRDINDLHYGQLAASQSARTNFTPGTISARAGDMNWPKDWRIPVGLSAFETSGPLEVQRVRIEKLGRNIVCDQTIPVPPDPSIAFSNLAVMEKTAGHDWAKGV